MYPPNTNLTALPLPSIVFYLRYLVPEWNNDYHLFKYSPSESCCIMLEIIRTNVSVPAALTMSGQPNLLPPFNINYVQPNDNSQRRVMINKILLKA